MARKGGNNGPRGRGRRTDFMNALQRGERTIFVTLSKVVVVALFLLFAIVSAAHGSPLVTALAGVGVFITAAVLLPIDAIRDSLEWFTSGKAGEWLHNSYLRVMPGRSPNRRDRRGQATLSRILALALTVALVSSLLFSGFAAAQDSTDEQECAAVTHDGYLTDESYVAEFEENSQIESTERNVRTSIEETEAFVRLKAENPNAYCVDMTVKVHPDIIPPADVGELSDTDGDVESTWRNTHDFERDQSYTEITFRLEPESNVTFAPNRVRVLSVAWADKASDPKGILDRITSPIGGEKDLEQRSYTLDSGNGSIQTIPLENSDGQAIDEWQAVYRVGSDDRWRPITTDSADPAFYRTVDNGSAVQFHFDTDEYPDGKVEVEFTANPTDIDKARHHVRSYSASWSDLFNFNFDFISTAPALPAAEVAR